MPGLEKTHGVNEINAVRHAKSKSCLPFSLINIPLSPLYKRGERGIDLLSFKLTDDTFPAIEISAWSLEVSLAG